MKNDNLILKGIAGLFIILGFMSLAIVGYMTYNEEHCSDDDPYVIIHEQHRIIDELTEDVAQRDQWIWDAQYCCDSLPEINFSRYYEY